MKKKLTNTNRVLLSFFMLLAIPIFEAKALMLGASDNYYHNSEISYYKQFYYKLTGRDENNKDNKKLIDQYLLAAQNYNKNSSNSAKIPQIIHRIWLGNDPLPNRFNFYIETCKLKNPGWQYRLWTNKDVETFDFTTKELLKSAKSYAEQADILRLEILKKYGGFYLDADLECLQNFDDIAYHYNFIVSMDYAKRRLLNGFIAASPGHPLIDATLKKLSNDFVKQESDFFQKTYNGADPLHSFHRLAINRTMMPISDVVIDYISHEKDKNLLVLPLEYCMAPYNFSVIERIKKFFGYYLPASNSQKYNNLAICNHNNQANYSDLILPKFSLSIGKQPGEFIPFLYDLFKSENNYYREFEFIYNKNYPSIVPFQATNIIEEKLHFIALIDNEKLMQWRKYLPNLEVKEWHKDELEALLSKNNLASISNQEEVRLAIASLIVLRDHGGVFVSGQLLPANSNMNELFYKYSLFASLTPINSFSDKLLISTDIIAAKTNQIFISKIIDYLAKQQTLINSKTELSLIMAKIIAENLPLDQRIIIFPGSFFYSGNLSGSFTNPYE